MPEQQVVRGFLASVDLVPPLVVRFQFNPASITDDKKVTYTERRTGAGTYAPGKQYVSGGDRTLAFKIQLYDRGIGGGIAPDLAVLRAFLYPRSDAWAALAVDVPGRSTVDPPLCLFGFGERLLHCWVTGLSLTEQQYDEHLLPVRAEVSVTLTVVEESDDALHRIAVQERNALAALGTARAVVSGRG